MRKQPKEKKPKWVDDGRTIADMNLPGTKWYDPSRDAARPPASVGGESPSHAAGAPSSPTDYVSLTKKERRALIRAAFGLALKLALIVVGGFALILLFLQFVWLS